MLVVLAGMMLIFADTRIGIFVVVLGVMLWASQKARRSLSLFTQEDMADHIDGPDELIVPEIASVRRDRESNRIF